MSLNTRETAKTLTFVILLASFNLCTHQWTDEQNEDFCRDVLSCTRKVDNESLVHIEDSGLDVSDVKALCERASQCTSTDETKDTLTCDVTDVRLENDKHRQYTSIDKNKTELCSVLGSCVNITSIYNHDQCVLHLWNISHYCPYENYCGLEKSLTIAESDNTSMSCCAPCSCSPDCGKHRECCFPNQDKYQIVETEQLTCVTILGAFGRLGFYMVNTCRDSSVVCYTGTMPVPVSSASSKRIFINEECAICNDKHVYTKWKLQVPGNRPERVLECLDKTYCSGSYGIPTEHMSWVRNFACGPAYLKSCPANVKDKGLIEACENIHAPVIIKKEGYAAKMFGNVYCIMCKQYMSVYTPSYKCEKGLGEQDIAMRGVSFAMVLDTDVIQSHKRANIPCIKIDGLIHPQVECRTVLCPEWMIRVNTKCQYYTKEWKDTPVTFQLILRPYSSQRIKASLFQNMTKDERFHLHTWLSNEGGFSVNVKNPGIRAKLYMLPITIDDVTMVEEFLVRIQYVLPSLNPASFFAYAKRAVESRWKINRGGKTYYLSATFYHYKSFLQDGKTALKNTSVGRVSEDTPLPKIYEPITLSSSFYYLGQRERYVMEFDVNAIEVTKMVFCDRIVLQLDEVELTFGHVYIRYNNKTLGDGEFSEHIHTGSGITPTYTLLHISVCKEDLIDTENGAFFYRRRLSVLDVVTLVLAWCLSLWASTA